MARQNRNRKSKRLERTGAALLQDGEVDKAIKIFQEGLDTYRGKKDRAAFNERLGNCYSGIDEWEIALEYYKTSLRLFGEKRDKLRLYGRISKCLFMLDREEEAVYYLKRKLEKEGKVANDEELQIQLFRRQADYFRFAKKYNRAIECFKKSIRLTEASSRGGTAESKREIADIYKEIAKVGNDIGREAREGGNPAEGLKALHKTEKYYRKGLEAAKDAFDLAKATGKNAGAMRHFSAVVAVAHNTLGGVLIDDFKATRDKKLLDEARGEFEEALKMTERGRESKIESRVYDGFATCSMLEYDMDGDEKKLDDAIKYLMLRLEAVKDYKRKRALIGTHESLGIVYCKKTNYKSALWHYREALRLTKGHPETFKNSKLAEQVSNLYYRISKCYVKLGQEDKAEKFLEESLRELNLPGTNDASIQESIGDIFSESGNSKKALNHYKVGLELCADKAKCTKKLAVVLKIKIANEYINKGKIPKAKQYLEDSLTLARRLQDKKVLANAYMAASKTLISEGKTEGALNFLEESIGCLTKGEDKEDLMSICEQIAELCIKEGYNKDALHYYQKAVGLAEELGKGKEVKAFGKRITALEKKK